MKRKLQRTLQRRKQRLQRRLARKNFADQPQPMITGGNLDYQMSERTEATGCGGLGMIHLMARTARRIIWRVLGYALPP